MKKIIVLVVALMLALTACSSRDTSATQEQPEQPINPYLVLVNKDHPLPSDWFDQISFKTAHNTIDDCEFQVERVALMQFTAMREDLLRQDIDIELDSAYRSIDEQMQLWEDFEKEYGADYCEKYLAAPGYSEHHTGLAIDICLVKDGKVIDDNDAMLAETEIFAKIHQELANYGFILRYPEGKEAITGYAYEPWHFRYVGIAAQQIELQDMTLEEYLA